MSETPKLPENLDPATRSFFELMTKKEKIHPDLKPYLAKSPVFGKMLKHPLVFETFYQPDHCARINQMYLHKLKYVNEAIENKEWNSVIFMHERPYRMQKFMEFMDQMTDEEYWENIAAIWTDSENLWQYNSYLGYLMNSNRPGRENMMDDEEKEFLQSLPEEFTIYRGHQGRRNRNGWSWSLSYFKAKWFGMRWNLKGAAVAKAKVKKSEVLAYFDGRREFEIVVDPAKIEIFPMKPPRRKPWVQNLLTVAEQDFVLNKERSYHGVWHWEKVESNAVALAKLVPGCDPLVVQLFALLHDSKRINEDDDPDHGGRAADYVELLHNKKFLPLKDKQKEILKDACRWHNHGEISNDPTIGVCWDADRLDLVRVGTIPEDKYLSTDAAKRNKWSL